MLLNLAKNKSNLDSNLPAQICRLIKLHLLLEPFKLICVNERIIDALKPKLLRSRVLAEVLLQQILDAHHSALAQKRLVRADEFIARTPKLAQQKLLE